MSNDSNVLGQRRDYPLLNAYPLSLSLHVYTRCRTSTSYTETVEKSIPNMGSSPFVLCCIEWAIAFSQ